MELAIRTIFILLNICSLYLEQISSFSNYVIVIIVNYIYRNFGGLLDIRNFVYETFLMQIIPMQIIPMQIVPLCSWKYR